MSLDAGRRFGPYQIVARLGSGGMGEVYRALDTTLQREVALKVLPEDFARDTDRLLRFQREAITIARLNHPHVVKIYTVDQIDGLQCIAMELIEGVTLADFIPAGGLRAAEIVRIALALADAIGAAHARGIVHRDLKPANVMVGAEGWVTVLDFGLAKLRQEMQEMNASDALTTVGVTGVHQVIGTAAYMSPEQAEGRAVDARSDIFSFGVLLYEMATGVRPFRGESAMAMVSSILKDTPRPLSELRPDLPADLDRIVRRCLAKEADRRYQTALDIRNELDDLQQARAGPPHTVPSPRRFTRRSVAVIAAVVLVAGSAAFWISSRFNRATMNAPVRVTFDRITSQTGAEWFPSLSPDGKWIVYSGEGAGHRDIFLQSVSGQTPINLTADSDADEEQPAFSPDGERIAFRSSRGGGGLFVMGRTGEAVRRVAPSGFNPAWSPDGMQLVYSTVATDIRPQNAEQRGQIMIVALTGGAPRALLDDAMMPSWSPNGQRIAFAGRLRGVQASSNIGTMPAAGGDLVPVTRDTFLNWNPVWSKDGRHLYFVSNRGGAMNIWRVAIDQSTGQPQGEPEAITTPATYATHLSLSASGQQLAYSAISETQNLQRAQFNPATGAIVGEPSALTTGSRFWANPDPSPDGQWLVFYSQVGPEGDLYVTRADGSGPMRQLTSDVALDRVPRWSPDGNWIAMFSDRSGALQIWKMRPDGSELQQVTDRTSSVPVWSPDGRKLAVTRSGAATGAVVDADPRLQAEALELPPVPPPAPRFTPNAWSPDGQWIAGMNGFTTPGIALYSIAEKRYERLTEIGEWPVWLPDGRRILFVARGREFHIVDRVTKADSTIFSVVRDTLGPPRLTRDGRDAYFTRRITEADVWLATMR